MIWKTISLAASFGFGALLFLAASVRGRKLWQEYREMFTETARVNMSDIFLFVDPARLFYYNVLALAVVPALVLLATWSFLAAAASAIVVLLVPRFIYRALRRRRLRRFERFLPDALAMLAGSLRAGASLTLALEGLVKEMPAPVNQEFELFLREQRLGISFETAIRHMEERVPITEFQLVVSALRISREVGGNLTEIMDSLADTLRSKSMMQGKIESLTAQGKMQGVVMAGLPLVLGALLYHMEPAHMSKLFTTEEGWMMLGVIVTMETLGFLSIKKITTIDV